MANERKIAFSSKLSFGIGQVAEGLKNSAFGILVMFYYNQVLGVPGTLCGLALGIALYSVVAGFAVVSVWRYTHHRLDRTRHAEILSQLEVARQARKSLAV